MAAADVDTVSPDPAKPAKAKLNFQAVGSAPVLRRNKFRIEADKPFAVVDSFLRGQLQLGPRDALFLYVNQGFCPGLDEGIATLVASFGTGQGKKRELIVNYSLQPAWG